jgi:hypothetical protein
VKNKAKRAAYLVLFEAIADHYTLAPEKRAQEVFERFKHDRITEESARAIILALRGEA